MSQVGWQRGVGLTDGIVSLKQLRVLAADASRELRRQGDAIEVQSGTWHGRASRAIKTVLFEDRTQKDEAYEGAQEAILRSLKAAYGRVIGEKAFRAHARGLNNEGGERTPITGRHIQKMLDTATGEVDGNAGIAEWVGGIRGGEAPKVLLGRKLSEPQKDVKLQDAYRHIQDKVLSDIQNEGHQFWILDLRRPNGEHQRIGIHVDAESVGEVEFRRLDGAAARFGTEGLGIALHSYIHNFLHDSVTEMALYRAEERASLDGDVGRRGALDSSDDDNIRILDDGSDSDELPPVEAPILDERPVDEADPNAGIAEWIGGIRGGAPPTVVLGRKIAEPSKKISKGDLYDRTQDQVFIDIGNDFHQFWILDIGTPGGRRERVGIHVDTQTRQIAIRLPNKHVESFASRDLSRILRERIPDHFPDGVTEMALYRAEERASLDGDVGQSGDLDPVDESIRILDEASGDVDDVAGDPVAPDFDRLFPAEGGIPKDEAQIPEAAAVRSLFDLYGTFVPDFKDWAGSACTALDESRELLETDPTDDEGSLVLKNRINNQIRGIDELLANSRENAILAFRDGEVRHLCDRLVVSVEMPIRNLFPVDTRDIREIDTQNYKERRLFEQDLVASAMALVTGLARDGKDIYGEEVKQQLRAHVLTAVEGFLRDRGIEDYQQTETLEAITAAMDKFLARARNAFAGDLVTHDRLPTSYTVLTAHLKGARDRLREKLESLG